jgi:hypothetical protein
MATVPWRAERAKENGRFRRFFVWRLSVGSAVQALRIARFDVIEEQPLAGEH